MATKSKALTKSIVPAQPVESLIRIVRGQKIILDADLAARYGVETKQMNRAVKRNPRRFPETFMFQLTGEEAELLRCQTGTSNGRGGRRYLPYAFTEHGVVMLSSVLSSERAVEMSIIVVNAFVRMREVIAANKSLAARIEKLEHRQRRAASVIEIVVEDLDRLTDEVKKMKALPDPRKRRFGFVPAREDGHKSPR